jgi:hypothetical protein
MGCFFSAAAPVMPSWLHHESGPVRVPADLRAHIQLPRLLIEQQDGDVGQMKEVARDGQNSLQHLVEIKGGEHGLARFI